ncbi:MAG: hypothetical protein WB762_30695 [Candidatus Sulfotelmatobacter sp.]
MKFSITCHSTCRGSGMVLSFVLLCVTTVHSRGAGTALAAVPVSERPLLTKRLIAYTEAFRKKDWAALYDLVADRDKIPVEDGKDKVSKDTFIRDMQGTYDGQRLMKFTPVRTEVGLMGFDIYGCAEIPYGNQKLERIAAVRAVRERDNWYFANWAYAEGPEPCSHLSNPAWKPQLPLRLDEPMSQVTCELYTCEI